MLEHLNKQIAYPPRVVVMGAKGFVGNAIVENLQQHQCKVLALSRDEINLLEKDAEQKLLDSLTAEDVVVMVSAIAPCKNNNSLIDNLNMVKILCNIISKVSLRQVIYISSDAVYADTSDIISEATAASPTTLHGMMHLSRELMLKNACQDTPLTILRPSLLYGINDPHNGYGPNRFSRLIRDNKEVTLFGKGEEKRDHVFIDDLSEIVRLILLHKSQGLLNVATGNAYSFKEITEKLSSIMKQKIIIKETARQNPIIHRFFDVTACYKAFPSFQYACVETGLQKSVVEAINTLDAVGA